MAASVTLLYTANLQGDLALLPRLFSFIRQLRAYYSEEAVTLCEDDPAPACARDTILLLDLGDSCAPDVWHCQVTGGRSTLLALDGMGYDAANVQGILNDEGRTKLSDMVRLMLVDDAHPWTREDVALTTDADFAAAALLSPSSSSPSPSLTSALTVQLMPAAATHLEGNTLTLASVSAGQVGVARVCMKRTPYELEEHTIFDLPRQTQPDPTIAGIVDFVLSEARYFQKKQAREA